MRRRTYLASTLGVGTALIAGCSTGTDGTDPTDGGSSATGTFRLLISDQPTAIEDFESLDVTLSSARVFRAGDDETITTAMVNGTVTDSPASPPNGTTDAETDEDEDEDGGFVEFDLDDVTVDLTGVIGDRAVSILEGELEEGRYSGVELHVSDAEGVVDGETVDVKVPSDRLRIIKPFEIAPDAEISFVFDIEVVQRGPNGGYNLLPVIGKSGVSGTDVEVEEVDDEDDEPTGTEADTTTSTDDGGTAT